MGENKIENFLESLRIIFDKKPTNIISLQVFITSLQVLKTSLQVPIYTIYKLLRLYCMI